MITLLVACTDPPAVDPPTPPAWTPPYRFDGDADGFPEDEDCDDTITSVHPGMPERCNGLDDDCDGTVDGPDAFDAVDGFTDLDGDGFGGSPRRGCAGEPAFVFSGGDCGDADRFVQPGAAERCNGGDDDCDPATPDACFQCVWLSDGDTALRFGLDGTLIDVRPGCSFVAVGDDGLLYSDGGYFLEVRDPATCGRAGRVMQPSNALQPYLGDTGTSTIYDPESRMIAVARGPAGEHYVLYGAAAPLVESWGVARFDADRYFVEELHQADGPLPNDLAVGPDGGVYVLTRSEILRLPPVADDSLPEVVATLDRPLAIEARPGLLHVLEDGTDTVARFDAVTRAPLGAFVADAGDQPRDLAFLPDGTALTADYGNGTHAVRAFDATSGAALGIWTAGYPESPVARLALGPCP